MPKARHEHQRCATLQRRFSTLRRMIPPHGISPEGAIYPSVGRDPRTISPLRHAAYLRDLWDSVVIKMRSRPARAVVKVRAFRP